MIILPAPPRARTGPLWPPRCPLAWPLPGCVALACFFFFCRPLVVLPLPPAWWQCVLRGARGRGWSSQGDGAAYAASTPSACGSLCTALSLSSVSRGVGRVGRLAVCGCAPVAHSLTMVPFSLPRGSQPRFGYPPSFWTVAFVSVAAAVLVFPFISFRLLPGLFSLLVVNRPPSRRLTST